MFLYTLTTITYTATVYIGGLKFFLISSTTHPKQPPPSSKSYVDVEDQTSFTPTTPSKIHQPPSSLSPSHQISAHIFALTFLLSFTTILITIINILYVPDPPSQFLSYLHSLTTTSLVLDLVFILPIFSLSTQFTKHAKFNLAIQPVLLLLLLWFLPQTLTSFLPPLIKIGQTGTIVLNGYTSVNLPYETLSPIFLLNNLKRSKKSTLEDLTFKIQSKRRALDGLKDTFNQRESNSNYSNTNSLEALINENEHEIEALQKIHDSTIHRKTTSGKINHAVVIALSIVLVVRIVIGILRLCFFARSVNADADAPVNDSALYHFGSIAISMSVALSSINSINKIKSFKRFNAYGSARMFAGKACVCTFAFGCYVLAIYQNVVDSLPLNMFSFDDSSDGGGRVIAGLGEREYGLTLDNSVLLFILVCFLTFVVEGVGCVVKREQGFGDDEDEFDGDYGENSKKFKSRGCEEGYRVDRGDDRGESYSGVSKRKNIGYGRG